jgi:hypothetical protein
MQKQLLDEDGRASCQERYSRAEALPGHPEDVVRHRCILYIKSLGGRPAVTVAPWTLSVQPTCTTRVRPCARSVPSWAFTGAQPANSSRGLASLCVVAVLWLTRCRQSGSRNSGTRA